MRSIIYYKKLSELALKYIDESPCDPDITKEQLKAWNKLQSYIKEYNASIYHEKKKLIEQSN